MFTLQEANECDPLHCSVSSSKHPFLFPVLVQLRKNVDCRTLCRSSSVRNTAKFHYLIVVPAAGPRPDQPTAEFSGLRSLHCTSNGSTCHRIAIKLRGCQRDTQPAAKFRTRRTSSTNAPGDDRTGQDRIGQDQEKVLLECSGLTTALHVFGASL